MTVRRLGVLTSGGDCPGLNAVIRAVVKTAASESGVEVAGIRDGFHGLLAPERVATLDRDAVRGLLPRGGTILGSSNRGNPFDWRDPDAAGGRDRSDELVRNAERLGIDCTIVIGGDGSLRIAHELAGRGLAVVGVPKTIDNDIRGTDLTFGFDSAVATATDAIDRLHTTAESHHRVMVVEVMGRHVGWIGLASGLAGGADAILIPEVPYAIASIVERIEARAAAGSLFSIVVVAEGAVPAGGGETYLDPQAGRLGGVGDKVARQIEDATGRETRATVLGHIQRGGSPTAFDRVLATRYGAAAARLAAGGGAGRMVALQGQRIVDVPLADVVGGQKRVPVDGELVRTARAVGIELGEPRGGAGPGGGR